LGGNHGGMRSQCTDTGNLFGVFNSRKYTPMAWLGTLGQFDLDHFNHIIGRFFPEHLGIKISLRCPASEIPGADLPNQVPALHMVIGKSSFSGVVIKVSP